MEASKDFTIEEAAQIGQRLGISWRSFDVEQFHKGLNIELVQANKYPQINVTNNDPMILGKVVLSHLLEVPDYYTRLDQLKLDSRNGLAPMPHYYGYLIRRFFMIAGVIILIGLPFMGGGIALWGFFAILGILVLGILAGLTSPNHENILLFDTIVAILGFLVFEAVVIWAYAQQRAFALVVSQIVALLFLASIYYATKTWRGMERTKSLY